MQVPMWLHIAHCLVAGGLLANAAGAVLSEPFHGAAKLAAWVAVTAVLSVIFGVARWQLVPDRAEAGE